MVALFRKRFRRSRRRERSRPRPRPLQVTELEPRCLLDAGSTLPVNRPVTTDAGVQQMPSIAEDPLDARHLVVAYMDRSLVNTGYAGIGAAVSYDAGDTWQQTAVSLPAGFH